MNLKVCKNLVFGSITAYALIMTGCGSSGGSSDDDNKTKKEDPNNDPDPDPQPQADTIAPVITSGATASIVENTPLIHKVTATDANTITYSVAGGSDASKFSIDQVNGNLSFTAPAVDTDQTFQVTVRAEDASSNNIDQDITVTVTDAGAITNRAIMPLVPTTFERNATINIVTNTSTGFIWEDEDFNENNVTFDQAKAHCDGLKTAGINNWRLPTRADLFKMARYTPGAGNSFIADGFKHKVGGAYWTSEEHNKSDTSVNAVVWTVSFAGIGDHKVPKDRSDLATDYHNITSVYTRCVSGYHQPAVFSGTDRSTTRVDADTGLTWHSHVHTNPTNGANPAINANDGDYPEGNYTIAVQSCNSYGGYRLPDINELRSIVEYEKTGVVDGKVRTGAVFGDLTVVETTAEGDKIQDVKSFEGGFDTLIWTSTETDEGKIRTLYISPVEISDTAIDKNLTNSPGTPDPIRTICVKP